MREFALTTIDNKSNPITDYEAWRSYDTAVGVGYDTEARIARLANTSIDMGDQEYDTMVEEAMDELIRLEEEFGLYSRYGKPMYHIKVDRNGKIL